MRKATVKAINSNASHALVPMVVPVPPLYQSSVVSEGPSMRYGRY